MIEFIVGAAFGGLVAGFTAAWRDDCGDLKAENRALRNTLRLARTWAFQSRHQFLVSIIDRALGDEAGA